MIDTIMFDLDGTLLPMADQKAFVKLYLKAVAMKFGALGYDAELISNSILAGTKAMMTNDGTVTNEERFWQCFESLTSEAGIYKDTLDFDGFYENEFSLARRATSQEPLAAKCVELLKEKGYTLVLATNPLFPPIATRARISWAGLKPDSFSEVTTYENYGFCKPSVGYYNQILEKIGKSAKDCLMIGNDMTEDMVAAEMGIDTYLLTDCLINRENKDTSAFKQGNFSELYSFLSQLPTVK